MLQVCVSEYVMQDTVKSQSRKLAGLPRMVAPSDQAPGLLAVGANGVWVCPYSKNILHICRGSLTGLLYCFTHL